MATHKGYDAGASGASQAQTTSGESEQRAESAEKTAKQAGRRSAQSGTGSPIQHFDTSIVKIDKDGNEVISDHLMPGERLRSATTDAYATVKKADRAEASEQDRK